ncbi:hypothetical protein AWV80_37020 [Cupriavidus sp. UYMU48A]|nr:hypothetical protein AWV80_37020 [Cupriavidus sp. UYMU48A]
MRALFDALTDEPVSPGRESLRLHLATRLLPAGFSADDIRQVLCDYLRLPRDNVAGKLSSLQLQLERTPAPALFDDPVWPLQRGHEHVVWMEVHHLLEAVLAATIRKTADLTARRLWVWLTNVDRHRFADPDPAVVAAVQAWLDAEPGRDAALMREIVADESAVSWAPLYDYRLRTGRQPSAGVVQALLDMAERRSDPDDRTQYLALAVEAALQGEAAGYWLAYHYLDGREDSVVWFDRLRLCDAAQCRERARRAAERRQQEQARQAQDRAALAAQASDLASGRRLDNLRWAAGVYFGTKPVAPSWEHVVEAAGDAAAAIAQDWRQRMLAPELEAAELGAAHVRGSCFLAEMAALAGLDRTLAAGSTSEAAAAPVTLALVVLKSSHAIVQVSRREQIHRWAVRHLESQHADGVRALMAFWEASLDAGESASLCGIWWLADLAPPDGHVGHALAMLLASRPAMAPNVLHSALVAASKLLSADTVLSLATHALADAGVTGQVRCMWAIIAFAIDPTNQQDPARDHSANELAPYLGDELAGGLLRGAPAMDTAARVRREAWTVQLLGDGADPEALSSPRHDPVRAAIAWLERCPDPIADAALRSLIAQPELDRWRNALRHALAAKVKARQDNGFRHPSVSAIRAALAGGTPATPADLTAVVVDQLMVLRDELRTADTAPWRAYWNIDANGRPLGPRIENACRDVLLARLQDRLQQFGISAALPEAQRANETRADVLVLGAGANVPIEVKRHFHEKVWVAASDQLQGYTADLGAAGHGVYLVFWFGKDQPPPRHPAGWPRRLARCKWSTC